MSNAMVIASREIRERSRLFLMCAAMAVLPFLIALVPAAKNDRSTVIATAAFGLATVMALGISVALGTSTIGGDLAARRLSYYFAKPISPAALWFGKAAAAMLTCFAAFGIIAIPAFLATGTQQFKEWSGGGTVAGILSGLIVVMFLFSHMIGTMVRSRSAIIGIDFALAFATGFALFLILRPLLLSSQDLLKGILISLGIGLLVIFAVAPVWQLANGRTDIRRSHAALSRALWISVAALLVVTAIFVWWVVSMDPADLRRVIALEQAPGSNTFLVSGHGKGRADYYGTFMVNGDTGKSVRLDTPLWWGSLYSGDGRVAAWLRPYTLLPSNRLELYTRRLDDPKAQTVATGIRVAGFPFLAMTDDGSLFAIADNQTIAVYETANQRLVCSLRLPFARTDLRAMFFTGPDSLRVLEYKSRKDDVPVRIYEVTPSAKKIVETGAMHGQMGWGAIAASKDGSRMLFRYANAIGDGRTGALIAKLPVQPARPFAMTMLDDGRVVALAKAPNGTTLHLISRDGQPIRDIALPSPRAIISAQVGENKLLVNSTNDPPGRGRHWSMHVVDLAAGKVERSIDDVRGPMMSWHDPRLTRFADGQKIAGVAGESSGEGGRVVIIDLRTGTHAPLPS